MEKLKRGMCDSERRMKRSFVKSRSAFARRRRSASNMFTWPHLVFCILIIKLYIDRYCSEDERGT